MLPQEITTADQIDGFFEEIANRLKYVGEQETPEAKKKKVEGYDYVEFGFMKSKANQFFPGWSFEILNDEIIWQMTKVGNDMIDIARFYKVTGRLIFFVNGFRRSVDGVAAHRIQLKSNKSDYVNMGNDMKAAVSDCQKKLFNVAMNICEDVYSGLEEVPQEMVDEILGLFRQAGKPEAKFKAMAEAGNLTLNNANQVKAKLEILIQEQQNEAETVIRTEEAETPAESEPVINEDN